MEKIRVGFAMCGSFCTFSKGLPEIERLVELGYDVVPIMSEFAYATDTRFGKAEDFIAQVEEMTGKKIIHTIDEAEPIGPKKLLDVLVIAPCTGNTLGKLACGITDSSEYHASTKQAMMRSASETILALDDSKFDKTSFVQIAELTDVKLIVTNRKPSEEWLQLFDQLKLRCLYPAAEASNQE